MNKQTKRCIILQADLACWRRTLFSASKIERGRYTCWQFTVMENRTTAVAQYDDVRGFPIERNKCRGEEACGMEVWPCRIGNRLTVAALRWRFPIANTIYCTIGSIAALFFAVMASIRFHQGRKRKDNTRDDDEYSSFDDYIDLDDRDIGNVRSVTETSSYLTDNGVVPFSFRKRLPPWMEDRPREPRVSSTPTRQGSECSP